MLEGQSVQDAVFDFKGVIPPFVRGFLAYHDSPAWQTSAMDDAGLAPPPLWADYKGKRCRVCMVSALGDVGINYTGAEHGYSERVSIYDLENFGTRDEGGAEGESKWISETKAKWEPSHDWGNKKWRRCRRG